MTRINLIPVTELTQKHLLAEYREMLRLRHIYPRQLKPTISKQYKLGKGHVLFFADKGLWLLNRHRQLREEMHNRGYVVNYELDLSSWPQSAMNDWYPNEDEIQINRERILERLNDSTNSGD